MSRAIAPAYDSDYPYDEESDWAGVGWQVPVEYAPLDRPIPRDAIPLEIRIANHTSDNGPFNKNGYPAQGYFFEVSKALALTLMELIGFDPAQDDVVIEQPPGNQLLEVTGTTDVLGVAVKRAEQTKLRQTLLEGRDHAPCGICGRLTGHQYLVAAHIKPRHLCTEVERLDPNVAMLACLIGCDVAFENGGLIVDDDGYIKVSDALLEARPETFDPVHRTLAPAFHERTRKYFEARRKFQQEGWDR